MPTDRSRRLAACAAIGAVLVLGSGPTARAAVGSIDFKEMKVGLSHAHHRPMPPIIVVQRMNGEWKASALPVQFELSISAKVDTFSNIFRLLVGVPSIEKNNVTAWTAGFAEGSAKVEAPLHDVQLSRRCVGAVAREHGRPVRRVGGRSRKRLPGFVPPAHRGPGGGQSGHDERRTAVQDLHP